MLKQMEGSQTDSYPSEPRSPKELRSQAAALFAYVAKNRREFAVHRAPFDVPSKEPV